MTFSRSNRRLRNARGFSLVETALAVAVVGVGILGVMGLFPTGLELNRRSLRDTLSTQFAAVVLEGLQAELATRGHFGDLESIQIPVQTALWRADPPAVTFRHAPELVRLADAADPDIWIADLWYRLDWLPVHRLEARGEVTSWNHVDGTGERTGPAVLEIPHPHMRRARLVVWAGENTDLTEINVPSGGDAWAGRVQTLPNLRIPRHEGGGHLSERRSYRNVSAVFYYLDFYRYD